MTAQVVSRITCILLIASVFAASHALERGHREAAGFQAARTLLLEGDYSGAEDDFGALKAAWFWGEEAAIGARLSQALQGEVQDERLLTARQQAGFPVELLLSTALREGAFRGCLRLARMTVDRPSSRLFESAALVELGELSLARKVYQESRLDSSSHWLAPRLREFFALPSSAGRAFRDRKGRLLAWTDEDSGGLEGLSGDSQLFQLIQRIPLQPNQASVRASLDLDLVGLATEALDGYRGTIVLLEPNSGEVLAAVSDPVTARQEEGIPAFEQRREPASIAKLITTSASLRSELDPDSFLRHSECLGAKRYQGGILYCAYQAGPLGGLDRSMAISCNIGFADLAIIVGRSRLLGEFRRFGFDQGSYFGRIHSPAGNQRQLADLAIGLEATDITPLHAALLAATVANEGRMVEPVLLSARDGRIGFSPRFAVPPPARRILSAKHNLVLKNAMLAVVEDGTGTAVSNPGFPVAMKTGTGRDPGKGGYHVNYIGFGPSDRPTIAFSVRVTNQATSPRVRRAGVEVTRRLLNGLARLQENGEWPYLPALHSLTPEASLAQVRASR